MHPKRVLKAYEAGEYLGYISKGSKSSQLEKSGGGRQDISIKGITKFKIKEERSDENC